MQRRLRALFLAVAGVAIAAANAGGIQAAIEKADPALLRAIESGKKEIRVIVGLKDRTTPARMLKQHPDPQGEQERRAIRLAAQRHVASQLAAGQLWSVKNYESF